MTNEKGEEITKIPDYHTIVKLRSSKIVNIVDEIMDIKAQMAELDERKRKLIDKGLQLMRLAEVKTVMVGEVRTTVQEGVHHYLDKDVLVRMGVSNKILKAATKETPYATLRLTERKAEEER